MGTEIKITPSGKNIGNSDLTIDVSGVRKLILGGATSGDSFTIRDSADLYDLAKFSGDGSIDFKPQTSDGLKITKQAGSTSIVSGYMGAAKVFDIGSTGSSSSLRMYDYLGNQKFHVNGSNGDIYQYGNYVLNGSGMKKILLGGALSTDSLTIRNSADNADYLKVRGNGVTVIGNTTGARLDIGENSGSNTYANIYFLSGSSSNTIQAYGGSLDYYAAGGNTFYSAGSPTFQVGSTIYTFDGKNFQFGTTTGTKIGTASNEKIAFWGAVPIVRPVEAALSNVPNSGDANTDALITALKNIIINTGLGSAV